VERCRSNHMDRLVNLCLTPVIGHTVTVSIGISEENGSGFMALGPSTDITGDGTNYILPFTAELNRFILPEGKYLAVRLTNGGATSLKLMAGAMASMLFAPQRSRPHTPLVPLLLLLE